MAARSIRPFAPGSTWTAANNADLQRINKASWDGLCIAHTNGYQCGSGRNDLWNPQISGVVYP